MFIRNSMRFCGICTPLTPPSSSHHCTKIQGNSYKEIRQEAEPAQRSTVSAQANTRLASKLKTWETGEGQPTGIRPSEVHVGREFDILHVPRVGNLTQLPSWSGGPGNE